MQSQLTILEKEQLLKFAKSLGFKSKAVVLPPVTASEPAEHVPLSFAQQRLWFLAQMEGASQAYHIFAGRRLKGYLDRSALRLALKGIVARHAALRTTFVAVEGEPRQRIVPIDGSQFLLAEDDLCDRTDIQEELDRLVAQEASAPFDLERGPLIRGRLVRLSEEEHALLITMHHIVSDGWSMGVLMKELSVLYGAFTGGEKDPLPALAVQYPDYAVWQRQWIEGDILRRQAEYWEKTLTGAPTLLELPADHARPAEQKYAGGFVKLVLDEKLTNGIKELSQRRGATVYMTLLAGWAALLGRLSGQEDIVIGTPVANRGRMEIEGLIGFFVNMLPLRLDVSGSPTARELLERAKTQTLAAQQNQDIPFEQMVEIARPVRSLAHNPLFQALFDWQHAGEGKLSLPGLELRPLGSAPQSVARFDLTLSLREVGERIEGGLGYATALFERPTVERYLGYWRALLEGMVADDLQTMDCIPILTVGECRRVAEWNTTAAEYEQEKCIHELFEEQVKRTPEARAVVFEDQSLSFRELNEKANRLACYLLEAGVGTESRVGVYLARSLEMMIGVLGVMKAGGTYVPLDTGLPKGRLEYMLEDAGIQWVLVESGMMESLPFGGVDIVLMDGAGNDLEWLDGTGTGLLQEAQGKITAGNLAYILYTSGSTGKPKGVMVPHGALSNYLAYAAANYLREEIQASIVSSPLSFDATLTTLLSPLLVGVQIDLLPEDDNSLNRLAERLFGPTASLFKMTPTHLEALEHVEWPAEVGPAAHRIVLGGEQLGARRLKRWKELLPNASFVNEYGPTETVVGCSVWQLPGRAGVEQLEGLMAVPIGCPIGNTRLYVLGKGHQLQPARCVGELYIGGEGVARGYLERADLTSDRFIPDSFSGEAGARLYRTGDLGRWLPDGAIEYLGRNDFLVKVRGYRIELEEIESRLMEHAGIAEAVVMAREDAAGDKRLVAYYTCRKSCAQGQAGLGVEQLRSHVGAVLPEYMVPAAYVCLEKLPLTPNGKLDRKALPAPEGDAYGVRGYEAPVGELETILAGAWSDVLKVEQVGRRDNFFELGGHSLLAVRLIERLRRAGLHVDIRALFATPVLAELAAVIGVKVDVTAVPPNRIPDLCEAITSEMLPLIDLTAEDIGRIVGSVPGGAPNIQDIYPLAPLQEGILFHSLIGEEGDPYLLSNLYSFDCRRRLEAYLAAMQAVIARHDILRTSVVWEGLLEPVQVVWRKAALAVEEVAVEAGTENLAKWLYSRYNPRHYRIDVRQAPLLRVAIAEDKQNGRWLMVKLQHHLAGDHVTTELMDEEIQACLLGNEDRLPAPLPFRNMVAQARLGVSLEEHEAFFRQMLGDVEEPTAPFGLLNVRGDGAGIRQARMKVDAAVARGIREGARRLGVSAASLCHAAWAYVLARVSGREDVVFGTVLFGRMQSGEGSDRAMGMFMNTLPLRIRVGEDGAETIVRRMHSLLAELLRHEHASLALAQRCSAVPAPAPLFSGLLNYRHSAGAAQAHSEERVRAREGIQSLYGEDRTNYPLTFSVDDLGDGFNLTVQVESPIDPKRVCQFMHTALESLVEALESTPSRLMRALQVLPQSERQQILYDWNATEVDYPEGKCLHELFEQQVGKTPEAVAVVCEDASLSYVELNRGANQLARHLRELGVGADARVAICADRGLELMMALLAVLKAGAAYVPLDPAYPIERLGYMLEDSAPVALLTQKRFDGLFSGIAEKLSVVELDSEAPQWMLQSEANLDWSATGDRSRHLAYVIYTSGSTGVPKGAMVEQRGMVNHLYAKVRDLQLTAGDVVAQTASQCFDISVWQFLSALLVGGRVLIVGAHDTHDPESLLSVLDDRGVTVFETVPSMLEAMIAEGRALSVRLGSLRWAVVTGEACPVELCRRWLGSHAGIPLMNAYGPTECSDDVTHCVIRERPGEEIKSVPIGKPLGNTQVYVLDKQGEPVPFGVSGELYVGGDGVGRGYLNRPEMTAQRFVPNPFAATQKPVLGDRLYRTGDWARYTEQGELEFLGRVDDQVKVRGYRIELGEIESALRKHGRVEQAAVIVREDEPGQQRLVAYVVRNSENDGEKDGEKERPAKTSGGWEQASKGLAGELRKYLQERLPEYMVPTAYVELEMLPLTPNGKIDRKRLPTPEGDAYMMRRYEEPRGEIETALARIWTEVLKVEQIGRNDNFFELGGHSLLVVRVISRLRKNLNVEVAIGDLFARPVLAEFAGAIGSAAHSKLPAITVAERGEHFPLSLVQQRLWFLAQIEQVSQAYHISRGMQLKGQLDRWALRHALDRIVERHEALRTIFVLVDGRPRQQIVPAEQSRFHLVEHDLSPEINAREELDHWIELEAKEPFNLESGPLIRGRLARMDENNHALLITMHHIVSDGWSMGVLMKELSALYGAFARGEWDPLPQLGVQYSDYAVWQRKWMEGDFLRRQAEYWEKTLAGAPALLSLPADHARPAEKDYAGGSVSLVLDEKLTGRLREFSHRRGTTLYMTLLAGWVALLARLSGQEDIVVGTPVANRGRLEIEGLIGFFVNTLALRLDTSGSPTVVELLERVKTQTLNAQQHQDIPFEQVVEIVRPVRSLSHNPLFQVMFVWQAAREGSFALDGLRVHALRSSEHETAKFDMTLVLQESRERITGCLEYATSLFERPTVERYVGYLHRLLAAMVEGDTQVVDRLPLVGEVERRQVLVDWNDTAREFPNQECLHELFERRVSKTPEAVALTSGDASMTYAALNRASNRLAHYLRELGVKPDSRVGLCVERGLEMMVGLFGVLKAGGAYVPMDPAYPIERLQFILEDSAPVVLLTQRHLQGLFSELRKGLVVIEITDASSEWREQPESNPDRLSVGFSARNLAYVIYTSGSTGKPKGVMVEHCNVCNYVRWADEKYYRVAGAGSPAVHSIGFDGLVTTLYGPILAGQTLALPSRGTEMESIAQMCSSDASAYTLVKLTPSHLKLLNQTLPAESKKAPTQALMLGGEALVAADVQVWQKRFPGTRLINHFGPTETTVGCCTFDITTPITQFSSIPIGRPVPNTRAYILDKYGEPAPVGVIGELYIGGIQVTRGYLNRPELTAERFLGDPFIANGEGRMYRTGDLARWRADGTIEFMGRNDFQVKIRGHRIELGEIEARLGEHEAVRDAVVIVREDTPGDKRLVAYYTAQAENKEQAPGSQGEKARAVNAEELRLDMAAKLPEYMVPAAYVRLRKLPLTPNGKLDLNLLPVPEADAYAAREYEEPVGDTEKALAGIWADVLKVQRVGRRDNFFELGGHSLLVVLVVSRLRQILRVEIAISDLFTYPVLADLARSVESATQSGLPPISPVERGEPLPLSFAQQRLWFLAQMQGMSQTYHISYGLRLKGQLDRWALRQALDRIVARHEALRTTFASISGEPWQWIAPIGESRFHLVEHELGEQSDVRKELADWSLFEAKAPFDLENGPLIRGRLIVVGKEEHALLISMHHIVSDGWSMGVLVRELSVLYGAFARKERDPLPELGVQYADYAAWQRKWMEGEILQRQAEYWEKTLAGAPALLELPADHIRPPEQNFEGGWTRFVLDEKLTRGLKKLSRRHGATLYMTILAAWAALLSRLSGQEDIVIGMPVANRGRMEIEGLIGFFVNTLALRLDVSGSPAAEELLDRVKRQTLSAQQHQDMPFEQVVEIARPVRSLAHNPLFQVMFDWEQRAREGRLTLPGLAVSPLSSAIPVAAKFDLTLSLQDAGERIVGGLRYATALFQQSTAERHLEYLRAMLEGMVADSSQPVDRLSILTEDERHRVLVEWNGDRRVSQTDKCVHELFEEQARKAPEAVAAVFEDATLSYGELNRRANQLARYLRTQGVGPEVRVGICMQRSLDMVVGLMAVLKAGGTYVPLDPEYPVDRLQSMMEDSGMILLLTLGEGQRFFGEVGETLPVLDVADRVRWQQQPETNLECEDIGLSPECLAYVIYTSGSTGKPKGSEVPHRSIPGFILGVEYACFDEQSILLQHSSVSWDALTLELWPALLTGGRCVLAHRRVLTSEDVREYVQRWGVNTLWLTAALFSSIVDSDVQSLQGIRDLMTGGEAVSVCNIRQALEQLPETRVVNGYGPSECTVFSSCHVVPRELPAETTSLSIGKPIGDRRVYVLDDQMNEVPIGVVGEACIGGPSVARGYLRRPELTAEKFVADPFSDGAGERLYRSGDLVRWKADGSLEFIGRVDHQVKVRGYRIELGEIEARLTEHPEVREAVVIAREDAAGEKRLVAYYAWADEKNRGTSVDELRTHLSAMLPEYMVPSAYVELESLPLTSNGKLDRKLLPAPESGAYAMRRYEAPVGEIETVLAEVWARLLKIDRVGRHDNFFEIGGHSLLAVRLVNLLEQVNINILVVDLFMGPTIESLARRIGASGKRAISDSVICMREGGADTPLFLAFPFIEGRHIYDLTPHLDSNIPLYGLPLNPKNEIANRTVEGMATRMVRMIRAIQPMGPYRVGGYSYGGILAYEIAAQLIGADQEVSFLGLFDTHYHGGGRNPQRLSQIEFDDKVALLRIIEDEYVSRHKQSMSQVLREELRWSSAVMDFPSFAHKCRDLSVMPEASDHLTPAQLRQIVIRDRAIRLADIEYYAQPLPVPVHLFAARENKVSCVPGWAAIVPQGRLRVLQVDGDHGSIWRSPNVESFGSILSKAIYLSTETAAETPERNYDPLVRLQSGRLDTAPVFCLPGAGAGVTSFTELVTCLDRTRPVYGFQPRGLEGELVPHSTVFAAAESYVQAIDKLYPFGPIHLLGHSFGGWVAFQMAQVLLQRGRAVASLIILDSEAMSTADGVVSEYSNTEAVMQWVDNFELVLGRPLGVARKDIDSLPETAQRELLHGRLANEGLMPLRSDPDMLQGPLRAFVSSLRTHYKPDTPYLGPLRLVLVDDPQFDQESNRRNQQRVTEDWKRWAPNLTCVHGSGNHFTVLKPPHVLALANMVQAELSLESNICRLVQI